MKKRIAILLFLCIPLINFAEDDTTQVQQLSEKDSKALLDQITKNGSIKNDALIKASDEACTCIDSINSYNKSHESISKEIKACIDKEVVSYMTIVEIFESLNKPGPNVIGIATDTDTKQYKFYYYEIERKLMDTCIALQRLVKAKDKVSKYSFSEDKEAMKQYNFGLQLSNKDIYEDAIPYYKKAVEIDPKFAFAWDNLGICYRKTNKIDKAIDAYKKSLEINPMGEMPLQNLAVAYELKKEYDNAIDAYKDILGFYPNHVEAFYGLGRLYVSYKNDNVQGLEYMCKAYNLYVKMNSPYRVDAEKMISAIYGLMKSEKKEKKFNEILKENNISPKF